MKKKETRVPPKNKIVPVEKNSKIPSEKPEYDFITPWTIREKEATTKKKKKPLAKSQDIFYHFG